MSASKRNTNFQSTSDLSTLYVTMNRRSHYEVLGVPQSASGAQIKKAYHKLTLETHPDKTGGSSDEFRRVGPIQKSHGIILILCCRFSQPTKFSSIPQNVRFMMLLLALPLHNSRARSTLIATSARQSKIAENSRTVRKISRSSKR